VSVAASPVAGGSCNANRVETRGVETQTEGTPFIAASYHAPPGVNHGIVKPRQAVAFASRLSKQNTEWAVLFGADANTPLIDAFDFANTLTHWNTGDRHLHVEPGDDLLFGPGKVHNLDDALRRWLDLRSDDNDTLPACGPVGHLAITRRTGKRRARRAPGGASILSGSAPIGSFSTSNTDMRRASRQAATMRR
jgi:hypothetical protein